MKRALPVLLMSLVLLLILCPVALAGNESTIELAGLGTAAISPNIEVTSRVLNGAAVYELIVKDTNTWRGSMLIHAATYNSGNIDERGLSAITDTAVKTMLEKSPSSKLLSREDFKPILIKDKKIYVTTVKLTTNGIVVNVDFFIFNHKGSTIMLGLMCADSDASYWRPIYQKIISDAI